MIPPVNPMMIEAADNKLESFGRHSLTCCEQTASAQATPQHRNATLAEVNQLIVC